MVQKKLPSINSAHGSETRNIINEIIKAINDRGLEILSESGFLTWLANNEVKVQKEVQSISDLPSNDPINTVRGVLDDNKLYIKKNNGWIDYQTIDLNKINYVENKVDGIAVTIDNYPKIVPEVDDGPRIQRGIDDLNNRGGGTLMLPEQYTSSVTLIIKENVNLFGMHREFSTITFTNPVVGIKTDGRTDNFNIKHLTIQGEEAYLDTIGIHVSNYSSYYQIEDMHIKRFGKWGIKADGGIKWTVREVDFWVTGRNASNTLDSGSFFVDVGNDDYTLRSVQARIESCYARGGGQFALKLYRPSDIQIDGFIAEYHEQALYAENASGTMYNFYQEANTGNADEVIHLHDSQLSFIGGSRTTDKFPGGKIKRTWSGVGSKDRMPVQITSQDIQAREVTAVQVNLASNTPNEPSDGTLIYSHPEKELKIFSDGEFRSLVNNHNSIIPSNSTKTFNLGNVNKPTSGIIEISKHGEANVNRYSYHKYYYMTSPYGEIFKFELLDSIDTLFGGDGPSLTLNSSNEMELKFINESIVPAYLSVKLNNLYGKRNLKEN